MTATTGMSKRIVAYVAAHPGCTRAQLVAGCGITNPDDAMPTYCRTVGLIFAAGPRGSTRYYPDAEQAYKAHPGLVADAARRREEVKRRAYVRDNLRERAARHAAGGKVVNSRPDAKHRIELAQGVTLAPDVRITIAPPMRDRWAA